MVFIAIVNVRLENQKPLISVSAFGGALLWMVSPATNFITAFVCGLLGTIYFAIYGKDFGADAGSASKIARV